MLCWRVRSRDASTGRGCVQLLSVDQMSANPACSMRCCVLSAPLSHLSRERRVIQWKKWQISAAYHSTLLIRRASHQVMIQLSKLAYNAADLPQKTPKIGRT